MLLHYVISAVDSAEGNYAEALQHIHAYVQLKDNLFSAEKARTIEELQAQYEVEKKNQEIELLQRENELTASETQRQNNLKNAFIAGSVLLIALLAILYSRFRLKRLPYG